MKITVDLPDHDLRDICRYAGVRKKGPAIRKMALETLNWRKRNAILDKFATGEWSADLPYWPALRKDRELSWK